MKDGPGAGGVAVLAVAVTAYFGGRVFLVAVLLLAGVALLELVGAMGRVGPRPVLIAAAVAAFGVPVRASAQPEDALGGMPAMLVTMVLLAFVLMIVTGRRSDVTAALGATLLCGALVGLGAGALVLLERSPGGWRWIAGLVVLAALTEFAARRRAGEIGSASLRLTGAVLAAAPAFALLATALAS